MRDPFSNGLEDGQRALKGSVRASGHDAQAGGLGADLSAGNGGIDPGDALGEAAGRFDARGSKIDDQGVGMKGWVQSAGAEDNLVDDARLGEVDGDDAVADFAGEVGQGCGAVHADSDGGFGRSGTSVPHPDFGSRVVEMARHGAAHVAQTHESDLVP